jgi:hypothetical protein
MFKIRVPERDGLDAIIEPLYKENRANAKFYCGADLEDAVNRAYLQGARRSLPAGGRTKESLIEEIHLTEDDLTRSLIEVPRSIQKDAVDQFLQDLNRFCDREIAESISNRLRPSSVS